MHFWGQSAWLRITFGDLVGRAVDPDPSKPRGGPEHTQSNSQVHVLLLFVDPSDHRGCFAGELCLPSAVRRSRAGNAPHDRRWVWLFWRDARTPVPATVS